MRGRTCWPPNRRGGFITASVTARALAYLANTGPDAAAGAAFIRWVTNRLRDLCVDTNQDLDVVSSGSNPPGPLETGIDKVQLEDARLVIRAPLTFDEWESLGTLLVWVEGGINWWLGDWLLHGEQQWGETYAAAQVITGKNYQTLANCRWVAAAIPPVQRRPGVNWSIHQLVAGEEYDADRDYWLDMADHESLTVAEMRERLGRVPALPPGAFVLFEYSGVAKDAIRELMRAVSQWANDEITVKVERKK